jgi:hypothetical protein
MHRDSFTFNIVDSPVQLICSVLLIECLERVCNWFSTFSLIEQFCEQEAVMKTVSEEVLNSHVSVFLNVKMKKADCHWR